MTRRSELVSLWQRVIWKHGKETRIGPPHRRCAAYGERLVERLVRDLTIRFGRGFSTVNLKQMRKFYREWDVSKIGQTASDESAGSIPPPVELERTGKMLEGRARPRQENERATMPPYKTIVLEFLKEQHPALHGLPVAGGHKTSLSREGTGRPRTRGDQQTPGH